MKFEINGSIVEAMDISGEDGEEEIGIWIPCTQEIQDLVDDEVCNIKIEIIGE